LGAINRVSAVRVPAEIAIVVVAPLAQTPAVAVKSTPISHRCKELMTPAMVTVILKAEVESDPLF